MIKNKLLIVLCLLSNFAIPAIRSADIVIDIECLVQLNELSAFSKLNGGGLGGWLSGLWNLGTLLEVENMFYRMLNEIATPEEKKNPKVIWKGRETPPQIYNFITASEPADKLIARVKAAITKHPYLSSKEKEYLINTTELTFDPYRIVRSLIRYLILLNCLKNYAKKAIPFILLPIGTYRLGMICAARLLNLFLMSMVK